MTLSFSFKDTAMNNFRVHRILEERMCIDVKHPSRFHRLASIDVYKIIAEALTICNSLWTP